eukprot:4577811-Lingulodinium_polyedra.AAC.1
MLILTRLRPSVNHGPLLETRVRGSCLQDSQVLPAHVLRRWSGGYASTTAPTDPSLSSSAR